MKICGIDQSTKTGIAFFDTSENPKFIKTGLIKLDLEDDHARIAELGPEIVRAYREQKPDFVVLEQPLAFIKEGGHAALMSNRIFGSLCSTLRNLKAPWGTIPNATWHKMAYGQGYKLPMIPKTDRRGDPVLDERGQPVLKKLDWKTRALQECDRLGIELPKGADRHNAAEAAIIALCWRGATPHGEHSVAAFQQLLTRRNAERKTA